MFLLLPSRTHNNLIPASSHTTNYNHACSTKSHEEGPRQGSSQCAAKLHLCLWHYLHLRWIGRHAPFGPESPTRSSATTSCCAKHRNLCTFKIKCRVPCQVPKSPLVDRGSSTIIVCYQPQKFAQTYLYYLDLLGFAQRNLEEKLKKTILKRPFRNAKGTK